MSLAHPGQSVPFSKACHVTPSEVALPSPMWSLMGLFSDPYLAGPSRLLHVPSLHGHGGQTCMLRESQEGSSIAHGHLRHCGDGPRCLVADSHSRQPSQHLSCVRSLDGLCAVQEWGRAQGRQEKGFSEEERPQLDSGAWVSICQTEVGREHCRQGTDTSPHGQGSWVFGTCASFGVNKSQQNVRLKGKPG